MGWEAFTLRGDCNTGKRSSGKLLTVTPVKICSCVSDGKLTSHKLKLQSTDSTNKRDICTVVLDFLLARFLPLCHRRVCLKIHC